MLACSRFLKGVVFAAFGDVAASRMVQGRRRLRETWFVNWGKKVASKGEEYIYETRSEGRCVGI
jgi:hypothetical protein